LGEVTLTALQTEYPFTLPKGYIDADGTLHRHGIMRMATARDEIEPLRDGRIKGSDDPYLTILVLARVITELGSLPRIRSDDVEGFFAADLAFLQDLYGIINFGDPADLEALQATVGVERADTILDEPESFVADDGRASPAAAERAAVEEPTPLPPRRARIEEVSSRSPS
jgi:hypothetical protein